MPADKTHKFTIQRNNHSSSGNRMSCRVYQFIAVFSNTLDFAGILLTAPTALNADPPSHIFAFDTYIGMNFF